MKNTILTGLILISQIAFSKTPAAPSAKSVHAAPADSVATAKILIFKPEDGSIEFSATGKPAMIKIVGHSKGPTGNLTFSENIINGSFVFELKTLDTGIELRDEHMKNKYLEVGKFPTAELKFTNAKIPNLNDSVTEFNLNGDLTLHGKTKPISVALKLKKDGSMAVADADFTLKIMDYLETLPSYAGIKVAEDVKITLQTKTSLK